MTRHGPALLALSIVSIAGWAYTVNYDTRAALERLSALRGEIAEQREALQVLRVEWAYLNAPDRLSRLVAGHNDTLALMPLVPEGLGIVASIPYPQRGTPDIVPIEPEALIAARPAAPAEVAPPEPQPELELAASMAVVALAEPPSATAPAPAAVAPAEPAAWRTAAATEARAEVETVPAALEAAIAAALVEVGVPVEAEMRSVAIAPAARPVAWSSR